MKKIIIAAKSDNDVIGRDNDLPWHLPADQDFFKKQIAGGFLLTGRRSFESPQGIDIFADRTDVVVVTRRPGYTATHALVAHSVEEALLCARKAGAKRVYILGGAGIYRQTIDLADELVITEVHGIFEGDAFFPPVDKDHWEELSREDHPADRENLYSYSFVFYRRRLV